MPPNVFRLSEIFFRVPRKTQSLLSVYFCMCVSFYPLQRYACIYFCKRDLLEDIQGCVSGQRVANASPERLSEFIHVNRHL